MQWGASNHMRFACVVCSLHVVYRVLATLRCDGSVAPRMRASVSGTEGRGFESLQAHLSCVKTSFRCFGTFCFVFCVGMCQDIVPFLSVMVVAGRSF